MTKVNRTAEEFEGVSLLTALICGTELKSKLIDFSVLTRKLASEITDGKTGSFQDWMRDFLQHREVI